MIVYIILRENPPAQGPTVFCDELTLHRCIFFCLVSSFYLYSQKFRVIGVKYDSINTDALKQLIKNREPHVVVLQNYVSPMNFTIQGMAREELQEDNNRMLIFYKYESAYRAHYNYSEVITFSRINTKVLVSADLANIEEKIRDTIRSLINGKENFLIIKGGQVPEHDDITCSSISLGGNTGTHLCQASKLNKIDDEILEVGVHEFNYIYEVTEPSSPVSLPLFLKYQPTTVLILSL